MFTGIIEEIGCMKRITRSGQAMVLTIGAHQIIEDVHLGDSINVNGVCLTVVAFDGSSITVDVMPETFRKTNLKLLNNGDKVNLERAMSAQGRFGGHVVQGHIDAPGTIRSRIPEENAVVFTVEPEDQAILKYMISRGSITLDGISLTLVEVSGLSFSVSIIPHTLSQTILVDKHVGDKVNIECDLLGKYVERMLTFQANPNSTANSKSSRVTASFLTEHGFK